MKIIVVVHRFPSVSETFILNHITGLIDAGHSVSIIALQRNKTAHIHETIHRYKLMDKTCFLPNLPRSKIARRFKAAVLTLIYGLRHPRKTSKGLYYLLCINREAFYERLFFLFTIMSQSYDLFHFHFGHIAKNGALLKAAGISLTMVTSFHGHDVNRVSFIKDKHFYRELFEYGDHFVANTTFTKQRAIELGCPECRISVIPVGLYVKDFTFKVRSIDSNEPVQILTVGRLVEKKGIRYSIEAVARLIKEGFKLHYTIAGDGPLHAELINLIEQLEISEYVTFTGEVTQDIVKNLYNKAHLFVLASVTTSDGDKEGQGLVLQEAQACGLPVISTLHNGIPDGVIDGKTGILVPEKNIDSLVFAIKTLLANTLQWRDMGESGRNFVEKQYDITLITNRLIDCYEKSLCFESKGFG